MLSPWDKKHLILCHGRNNVGTEAASFNPHRHPNPLLPQLGLPSIPLPQQPSAPQTEGLMLGREWLGNLAEMLTLFYQFYYPIFCCCPLCFGTRLTLKIDAHPFHPSIIFFSLSVTSFSLVFLNYE